MYTVKQFIQTMKWINTKRELLMAPADPLCTKPKINFLFELQEKIKVFDWVNNTWLHIFFFKLHGKSKMLGSKLEGSSLKLIDNGATLGVILSEAMSYDAIIWVKES